MNYVTIYEEYKHKFFQLPKVFFTNEKYIDMSNNAKVAWSLLRDRSSLSRKNGWFDKDTGRIYFIFTNEELMKLLNVGSKSTLSNIKKELESAKLIESKRRGHNLPNKMYLLYPEITEEDIYRIDEIEEYEYQEYERKKAPESIGVQGRTETGRPENVPHEVQNMYTSNTDSIYTNLRDLDTRDTRDTKTAHFLNDVNSMSQQEKEKMKKLYIERGFYENNEYIPEQLANVLKVFSNTPEQAKGYYDIILKAKKNVEKAFDEIIWLDHEPELLHQIINAFSRAIRKIERNRDVTNKNGYIYTAIYDLLGKEMSRRQRKMNNNGVLFNWIEDRDDEDYGG
ncbi:hypothetical protein DTX80_17755 [Bacilli bacterium]|nr:hypothetical protein DEJ64_15995 [Bacilli bacterium]PZD84283.1 hypothetical protein DEJ60_15015 [Bacilli bacterium]PZD86327.1 hypothetical protein DEJ66_15820 [Bacilli bacterium]RCO04295.1 hypothetical protein DTX80_17755 [Bacilli bacterium]RCO11030.1 hypothetical protein DTX79_01130 [Bacilli bacterium]